MTKHVISRNNMVCATAFILLFASLFFRPLIFACFVFCMAAIYMMNTKEIFAFLLFFFSFAAIFKIGVDSTSLFTILESFCFCVIVLRKRKLSLHPMVILLLFAIYMIIIPGEFSLMILLKVILHLALFALFAKEYKSDDSGYYLKYYIVGLIVSSLLGFFKEIIPGLNSFYADFNYAWISGRTVLRYSGIWDDPNFFTGAVCMGILVLAYSVLDNKKNKSSMLYVVSFFLLMLFGMIGVSKSFILLLAVIFVVIFIKRFSAKKAIIAFALIALAIVLVKLDPNNITSNIIDRFTGEELISNRTRIWDVYLKVISASPIRLCLGYGIGADYYMEMAAHNSYLATVYYTGIVGLFLYLTTICVTAIYNRRRIKRTIDNYMGFAVVAAIFFFLDGFRTYELAYYLMLSFIVFQNDFLHEEQLL